MAAIDCNIIYIYSIQLCQLAQLYALLGFFAIGHRRQLKKLVLHTHLTQKVVTHYQIAIALAISPITYRKSTFCSSVHKSLSLILVPVPNGGHGRITLLSTLAGSFIEAQLMGSGQLFHGARTTSSIKWSQASSLQ